MHCIAFARLVGINLSVNRMTEQGATTVIDTLADSNGTLAVLQLEGMRPNPSTCTASTPSHVRCRSSSPRKQQLTLPSTLLLN